ncbi:hypothetical protein HanLR1_Chr05g0175911 [Helianthus annuus]|nr:hypothetical protein HanLR1_Chr05g0175911 [Helianthus annuus]
MPYLTTLKAWIVRGNLCLLFFWFRWFHFSLSFSLPFEVPLTFCNICFGVGVMPFLVATLIDC